MASHALPALVGCPLCGGTAEPWRRKRGFELLRCRECGNGFVRPELVPYDLERIYSASYFEGGERTGYPAYLADSKLLAENFRDRIRWIERLDPPGRRLLEVGCAYGIFLGIAKEHGFLPHGVEIAEACAKLARERTGAEVLQGDFATVSVEGPFDVIVMFDVLEHLRNPVRCLERAHELLAPGGLLVIETGDLDAPWARLLGRAWYFLDPPQHLFYFSRSGLETLCRRAGFGGPSVIHRMGRRVSIANVVFKLLHALPEGNLRRRLVDRARRTETGSLFLSFGDSMLFAVRRAE